MTDEPQELEHLETEAVEVVEREEVQDGHTIEIRLLRWGEVAMDPSGYMESVAPGAFIGSDPSRVTIESQRHRGDIVGRGIDLVEREDGPYLVARISNTHAGNDLLTLINDGVLRAASVVMRPITSIRQKGGIIQRTAAELARVAILDRGAYAGAAVVAVREEAQEVATVADEPTIETPEAPAITPEPIAPPVQEEPVPPTPAPMIERAAVDLTPVTDRLDTLEQRVVAMATMAEAPAPREVPELFQLATLHAFLERAATDPSLRDRPAPDGLRMELARYLERALDDQISSDNPGFSAPGWLSRIVGIIDFGRPVIQAFGGPGDLPDTGLEVDWPIVTTPIAIGASGHMAEQTTQKTEVASAKISFGKGTSDVKTYAGASDISYQLLRRSAPSYLEAYNRFMLAAWAKLTDTEFADDLMDASVDAQEAWIADATGQSLKTALFAASVQVETATGVPAQFGLAATDVFIGLGGLTAIVPASPPGNPSNAPGTMDAGELRVNVAGLPILHARGVDTGHLLVSNRLAAQWLEDGPFPVTSEDVAKLGQNVGWYSFGASALFIPAGIVDLYGPGTGS
jgi:phage head maturation protease